MKVAVFMAAALLCCGAAHGQAFGVKPGAPVSDYSARPAPGVADPNFFVITVPQPNSEFETYTAVATPETGICSVSGIGVTHRNDEYGVATKSAFADLRQALTSRYGAGQDFDFLRSGALWDEPREWVWSIYKKERTLASFWTVENGSSLPAGVHAIALEANAAGSSSPYVSLKYEFTNFSRCKSIRERQENNGL